MLTLKFAKLSAANLVFIVSAAFHEVEVVCACAFADITFCLQLLLSVPTHRLRFWAFLGMVLSHIMLG